MGPFFEISKKTGPFQTSKRHKSAKTHQNPINLYIFEISIKFCVDWYIIWCISGKLKIFLYYRWQNLQVANRRWRRSLKIAKKISVLFVSMVNVSQSIEWKFRKSGNMKHLHSSSSSSSSILLSGTPDQQKNS